MCPEEDEEVNDVLLEGEKPTSVEELKSVLIENVRSKCVNLSLEHQTLLLEMLIKHIGVFGMTYGDMTTTDLVEFEVNTGEANPIVKKPNYHMNFDDRKLLKQELNTMLKYDIMEPTKHKKGSKGAWGFPCMFVGKKSGKKRLVVMF